MHIIQVAPLMESVPPQYYGGTERIVCFLTEGLVRQGHDVTLFASGDSQTSAHLVATVPKSLRLHSRTFDSVAPHVHLVEQVYRFAKTVKDPILHFHIDYIHFPASRRMGLPHFTTMHGRLDLPEIYPLHAEFREMPLVSISDAQRIPIPDANWLRTVHHGLPVDLYSQGDGAGGYLAFVGRCSPEKRVDRAIAISEEAGIPLKIAAKVDPFEVSYFNEHIRPLLARPGVEFVGEIGEQDKQKFFGNALALLFPIDWPEPFGLVMIEAMACGTPVVAFDRGSVREIVNDHVTGRVVNDVDEAVAAIKTLHAIDRAQCRRTFEEKFSANRMISEYVWLYKKLATTSQITA